MFYFEIKPIKIFKKAKNKTLTILHLKCIRSSVLIESLLPVRIIHCSDAREVNATATSTDVWQLVTFTMKLFRMNSNTSIRRISPA